MLVLMLLLHGNWNSFYT